MENHTVSTRILNPSDTHFHHTNNTPEKESKKEEEFSNADYLESEERNLNDIEIPITQTKKNHFTQTAITEYSNPDPQPLQVLVLDDQGFNARLVEKHLVKAMKDENFCLKIEQDINLTYWSALDSVTSKLEQEIYFSLILTDFNLDNGNTGKNFIEKVKSLYKKQEIPIPFCFLLSGEEPSPEVIAGFDKVLQKPYKYASFREALKEWFSLAKIRENSDKNP